MGSEGKLINIAVEKALKGEKGIVIYPDSSGVKMMSAYSYLELWGVKQAVVSQVPYDEALSNLNSVFKIIVESALIAFIISTAISFIIASSISSKIANPLIKLSEKLDETVKNRNLSKRFSTNHRVTEIKNIALSFNNFLDNIQLVFKESEKSVSKANNSVERLLDFAKGMDDGSEQGKKINEEAKKEYEVCKSSQDRINNIYNDFIYLEDRFYDESDW